MTRIPAAQAERAALLLEEAEAAYRGVLVDAQRHRGAAAELVERARCAEAPEAVVVGLRAWAWGEHVRLDNDRARVLLDQAARLATRHGLDDRLGEVLVSRAAVLHELGRLAAAQDDLDRAADLVGPECGAELVLQQAALHQNIGRLHDAARLYRDVLERDACPLDVRVKTSNNLALLEVGLGRWESALEHIEQAVRLAGELGPAPLAIVSQSRAWITMQVGRLAESLRRFEEAGVLYEKAGLPLGEHLVEYADALIGLRLLPEAQGAASRAAAEFGRHEARLMAAEAQLRTARLHLLADEAEEAGAAARSALALLRRQGRTAWVARAEVTAVEARALQGTLPVAALRRLQAAADTLEGLGLRSDAVEGHLAAGRLALGRGRTQEALASLLRAHRLSRSAPVLVRLRGRVAAALAAQEVGDAAAVLRHCRAGLDDLATHQAALPSMELRALASGHGAELGRLGLRAVLPSRAAATVLDWMDRTRAAALVGVDVPGTAGLEDELAALRASQAELEEARGEGQEPAGLVARVAAAETRVRQASWTGELSQPTVAGRARPADLRALLGDAVLVMYGSLDGQLTAVVLDRRRTRLVSLGPTAGPMRAAEAMLFALRRLTRPRSSAAAAAARASADACLLRLADLLVRPLDVGRDVPLVVVPSADLSGVPWSALHTAPVTIAPSAALWARTACRPTVPDRVALVAGPGLPGAATEVTALAELHPGASVLLPPHSTVEAVTAALQGASLAHLACHGLLRADNPMFSALVLHGGRLSVHELAARAEAPHRMVLAACESGVQVGYEGNEMLGFVSALFSRGTAGLVASTLVVPDLETVGLMRSLHLRTRAGDTLAVALHGARGTLDLDDPGEFVNWCAWNAFGAA